MVPLHAALLVNEEKFGITKIGSTQMISCGIKIEISTVSVYYHSLPLMQCAEKVTYK
jgi:hypothetical protein